MKQDMAPIKSRDNGRSRSSRFAGLAALFALLVGACGQNQPPPTVGAGPIKATEKCPLMADELVPGVSTPRGQLTAFETCVGRFSSNAEHAQASYWIRDWYLAANCLHKCDAKGNGEIAHESIWNGLRYIATITLPADDKTDADCRAAQRSLVVALDESMNNLAGWRSFSKPQCASASSMEATLKRIAEAQQYRNRLTGNISEFRNKRQ